MKPTVDVADREVGSAEEGPRVGRPAGSDRVDWQVKLTVKPGERDAIESAAERNGEGVGTMLRRLGLAEAERHGIPVPTAGVEPEILERLSMWAMSHGDAITTKSAAAALKVPEAVASKALQEAGFTKRRAREAGVEPTWERPGR